jgi:hypothetical protein
MCHPLYNPSFQPRNPAKDRNEVRVSKQDLPSLLPYTQHPQTMTLNSELTSSSALLQGPQKHGMGWFFSFMVSHFPGVKWIQARRLTLETAHRAHTCSVLILTAWPPPHLFCPLQSMACPPFWRKWKPTMEELRSLLVQGHSQHIISA